MEHKIFRVVRFEIIAPYTLRVVFDGGVERVIDLREILVGPLYGR